MENFHYYNDTGFLLNSKCPTNIRNILEELPAVFSSGLGRYTNGTVKFWVKFGTGEVFKARTLPLALKGKVEAELDRLVDMGVLKSVNHS